eukprot:4861854-Prymnesium_polylepis.1
MSVGTAKRAVLPMARLARTAAAACWRDGLRPFFPWGPFRDGLLEPVMDCSNEKEHNSTAQQAFVDPFTCTAACKATWRKNTFK